MEPHRHTPPDCFRMEALEVFQSFENQPLVDVNYYLWLNQPEDGSVPYRFLYFLELAFESGQSLLLTSGEDSEAIQVSDAETLVKTARALQQLHGRISIQRVNAGAFPLWQPVVGQILSGIRLSKNEEGFYHNDALLLDFGDSRILVQLSPKDGLEVGPWDGA